MVWIINEKDLFSVNEKLQPVIKNVYGNKVIIVDNFYKNPDAVRELTLNSPATNWITPTDAIAARHSITLNMSGVLNGINKVLSNFSQLIALDDFPFMTNLYTKSDIPVGAPHVDPCIFSCFIYLNSPEECHGGTAFYRHKETGYNYYDPNVFKDHPYFNELGSAKLSDKWEYLDHVEMKYNRLVMYEGKYFHSGLIEDDWFKDYYRINQVIFLNSLISNDTILSVEKRIQLNISKNSMGEEKFIMPAKQQFPFNPAILDFINLLDGRKSFGEIMSLLTQKNHIIDDEVKSTLYFIINYFLGKGRLGIRNVY